MPSLTSNKNKWSLPANPTPVGFRCISVPVPDDDEWFAKFVGQLYMLSQQIWWDRDDAHTARIVARRWQSVFLAVASGLGCEMSDCDDCLDLLRINPANGRLGWYKDGIGFFEVADGEWIDAPGETFFPEPKSRAGSDHEAKCEAAHAASLVLQSFFQQTVGLLVTNSITATFLIAQEIADMISAAFGGLIALDTLIAVALEMIQSTEDYEGEFFLQDAVDELRCILYNNATVSAGEVTFNRSAVTTDIDASEHIPSNGLNLIIDLWLGDAGLNAAGNVSAGAGECDDCDDAWCYEFDFTTDEHEWQAVVFSVVDAQWEAGHGWEVSANNYCEIGIYRAFTGHVTKVEIELESAVGGANPKFAIDNIGGGALIVQNGGTFDPVSKTDGIRVFYSVDFGGTCSPGANNNYIKKVTLWGTGTNPFGTDNCTE